MKLLCYVGTYSEIIFKFFSKIVWAYIYIYCGFNVIIVLSRSVYLKGRVILGSLYVLQG
jgi:hypothetical protein